LVTSYVPGYNRNDFSGEVGFLFRPTAGITFNSLGVRRALDNTSAVVNLYEYPSTTPLRTATFDLAGKTEGTFYYAAVAPVTLTAGTMYVVCRETTVGGEWWAHAGPVTLIGGFDNVISAYRNPGGAFGAVAPNEQYVGVDLALL
jgi:hypothetical protein